MNYHVWQCDRCGLMATGTEFPKYWAKVRVTDTNTVDSARDSEKDLCMKCGRDLQAFLQPLPKAKEAA